tara:strand:- start:2089 stop:2331 length:243 start_codon:yes stop_codon:yes gene_type:complete
MAGNSGYKFEHAGRVAPGDVLIDREGHEMIVVEVVNRSTGDCYALYNGEIKLINALRSSRIMQKSHAHNQKDYSDAKTQA